MAKKPTITTVATGYNSNTALNNNFNNIQAAFDNTLSRDGSTPNAMAADLDMNNNDILNADVVDCETLNLNGNMITSIPTTVTFGDSSYNLNTTNSDDRTITQRIRDRSSVKDFGAVGDGVTSDTTKLQDAYTDTSLMWFPSGTYVSSNLTVPGGTVLEADVDATLEFTFNAPLRKGNRFTFGGDYESTNGYLAHPPEAPGSNQGNSWQNALAVYRGTQTNPDTTALYARTAAFVEMHSNKVHTVNQSVWGNPYKTPALTVEHWAHDTFEGECNGAAFRAYSADEPESATDSKRILVGMSSLGQTNTGAGNDSWSVWGANIIAAQTSGNAPNNCVGIEVDINHTVDATAGAGPSSGNNFTAYWAQSGAVGVYSTAAFFASRTTGSLGWNYVLYSQTRARDWMAYLDNGETTATTASGIYAKIASTSGKVIKLDSGANTQLEVTTATDNPVFVRIGSALKALEVGAADSGGTGFRMVRVVN